MLILFLNSSNHSFIPCSPPFWFSPRLHFNFQCLSLSKSPPDSSFAFPFSICRPVTSEHVLHYGMYRSSISFGFCTMDLHSFHLLLVCHIYTGSSSYGSISSSIMFQRLCLVTCAFLFCRYQTATASDVCKNANFRQLRHSLTSPLPQ